MNLTSEQQRMADAIRDLIHGDTGQQTLVCHGVAGTGKTLTLTTIAHEFPEAILCAYTGKAAAVLREKSGLPAKTVHSLFYKLVDKGIDPKTKRRVLTFQRIHADGGLVGKVILLDECSMIDRKTAQDLLNSGAKIVAVGDPGQLPPVHGAPFFERADIVLTEIHRQALESAILRQAHNVREHGLYEADGEDFRVVRKVTDQELRAADAILCWRNVTRHKLNARMRDLLAFDLPYPMAGERVLCLKNTHQFGVFNGCTYELAQPFEPGDTVISLLIDGNEVTIPGVVFVRPGGSLDDYDDDSFASAFDYGYALTVHKSQGSEFDRVVLFDENHKHERQKWVYTGLTRAAKQIIVQGR
jgi:exodeoxyribonuclease V